MKIYLPHLVPQNIDTILIKETTDIKCIFTLTVQRIFLDGCLCHLEKEKQ